MSSDSTGAAPPKPGARIIAIDILRGWAILAIVLHHLWDDIRYLPYPPGWFYEHVGVRVRDGDWSSLPTTLLDALLSGGYLIPTFMLTSGLSLYITTASQGPRLALRAFYRKRLRYLMVPYWFSVAMVMVAIVAIALVQLALHGGGLMHQYHHVTERGYEHVAPGRWEFLVMLTVFPRVLHEEWLQTPPTVMWFVVLILQYYLLFPPMRRLLRRFEPVRFLAGALAVTVLAKLMLIAVAGGLDSAPAGYMSRCLAPFRLFEFALGMSLGYVLVHHRERLRELTGAPVAVAALLTAGPALIIGGIVLGDGRGYYGAVASPLVILGVAMVVLPLLSKRPGRLEATAPMRLLAWTGPFSYTVLIANEPLRLVASFLRVEGVPAVAWWLYLVAYMPLTLLAARPLASFLGITPRSLAKAGGRARLLDVPVPGLGLSTAAQQPEGAQAAG